MEQSLAELQRERDGYERLAEQLQERCALKLPLLAGALFGGAGFAWCTSNTKSSDQPSTADSTVEAYPVTADIAFTLVDAAADSDVWLLQDGDIIALNEFDMGLIPATFTMRSSSSNKPSGLSAVQKLFRVRVAVAVSICWPVRC